MIFMGCFLNFSFLLHLYKIFFYSSKIKSMKQGTFPSLSQAPWSSFLSRDNHLTFHFWFTLIFKKIHYVLFRFYPHLYTCVYIYVPSSSHTYTAIKSYGIIWSCSLRVYVFVCVCVYIYTHIYICLSCLISCL